MGRVYLCLGRNAEVPYYFERARAHVWNIEELCYFVRENAWLLEPSVLGRELMLWIGEQCKLPELAKALQNSEQSASPVTEFVKTLFVYTGYCSVEEVGQVEKILSLNESTSALERSKGRGDYFLESGKYVLAMQEYEELLKGLKGMEPSFLGKVYHNCGVAQAKLFLFEKAAASFEQAWKLTKSRASARQYLAAKRFSLGEQEYVDFLADRPDLYQVSMDLEDQVQACEDGWKKTEDAAFILHTAEAHRNGTLYSCRQLVQDRVRPLQEAYRSSVVR